MTPLFLYLLKVNIALGLFYLAYRYGLRRLTFYTLNRFFLLFAIAFSSAYPLISLDGLVSGHSGTEQFVQYFPNLESLVLNNATPGNPERGSISPGNSGIPGIWNVLAVIFWSGVLLMVTRFLAQLVSLARIHRASSSVKDGKQALHLVDEKINPFSFFRSIYINPELHSPEDRVCILQHERVHVRQWHTLDILAGEINRIFCWFNPAAWLLMTAIRENLEFITDRNVLQGGVDTKAYQRSLVTVSEIPYASALAHNFNFSHLKIRITMMNRKPSSELHMVKYLVMVPVIATIALAFNSQTTTSGNSQTSATSLTETTTSGSGIILFNGEAANGTPLSDTIPITPAQRFTIKGTADSTRIRIPTQGSKTGDAGLPLLKINEENSESAHRLTVSKDGINMNLSSDSDSNIILISSKTLILIDGKEYAYETAHKFPRDTIQTLLAIAGNAARKEYGKKGKYGVIKITTKSAKK